MQDFITSQLLTDKAWKESLDTAFNTSALPALSSNAGIAAHLRHLLLEGMAEELAEIDAIVANTEQPTFANTIVAFSNAGQKLERASTVMYNLLSAETCDELDELANEMASKLSEHSNNLMLNAGLFKRVKAINDNPPADLTPEDQMLLQKVYQGFERSGAALDEAGKQRFRAITARLSEVTLKFSQNVLKDTNKFVLHIVDEAELEGLPEMHRKAAAHEAEARNLTGWVFTLHAPSFGPFMMYAANRQRREELYRAYHTRCTHADEYDNFDVVTEIVNLRRELAQVLGYANYAEYALKRRMAQTPEAVYSLLNDLVQNYRPKALEEVAQVEKMARRMEGDSFRLMPWDFAYYSQKLKQALYDYDPDMLRPYFELSQVINGVFSLATRLYGITFEADSQLPVYHPDVRAYRVFDSDHQFLAVLYADFFPRASKQGGAWMTNYRDEHACIPSSQPVCPANSMRPVVSVTTNFTKPTADTPALLTLGEVETFLHEFGHALHGIFAMTHYAALSGTSVYWDFVELPSQFMENYATEPEFLHTFARHYQTGEPLPAEYIERIRKSRNFQSAYACMRQVSFGLLDMAYYTLPHALEGDVRSFENQAWARALLLPIVPDACMSVQFGHIMSGGYAAGYYSYKWAEVLDADAFALFRKNGIFDEATAQSFRSNILSKGGTEHPSELYRRFRGQDPTIDALLERDGIKG